MNTFFFNDVQYPEGLFGGKDFFNPIIYSTEERVVGVWIDNKPLYAKSFTLSSQLTVSTSSWTNTDLSLSDVEKFVNGYAISDGGTFQGSVVVDKSNDVIQLQSTRSTASYVKYLTVFYTKTTDVAGSGSYNTLGVPTVHYDGNERVVGTWFGETLYEKIINFDYNNIQSRTSSGCEIYINVPNIKDTKDSVILFEGGTIQFPYFVSTSIFIGGFTQTETDTFHISLRYTSSVYNELNAYLTDCRVKLQYTKNTD